MKIKLSVLKPTVYICGMKIAETINSIRKRLGYTQAELSKKSGVTQVYISAIELGKKHPSPKILDKIGKAMGLSGEILFLYSAEVRYIHPEFEESFQKTIEPARRMIDEIIDYKAETIKKQKNKKQV